MYNYSTRCACPVFVAGWTPAKYEIRLCLGAICTSHLSYIRTQSAQSPLQAITQINKQHLTCKHGVTQLINQPWTLLHIRTLRHAFVFSSCNSSCYYYFITFPTDTNIPTCVFITCQLSFWHLQTARCGGIYSNLSELVICKSSHKFPKMSPL